LGYVYSLFDECFLMTVIFVFPAKVCGKLCT